jgi:hypothetical protein
MIFVALQHRLMVNTEKEKTMTELMTRLLERLAEMFPDSGYQSKLEEYIASRHPVDVFDVERFERQYQKETQGWL